MLNYKGRIINSWPDVFFNDGENQIFETFSDLSKQNKANAMKLLMKACWWFFQCIYCLTCSGETQYNKDGLLQGKARKEPRDVSLYMLPVCLSRLCRVSVFHKGQAIDSRLSEIGQQQAEAAGQYLKDVKFSDVFVSDMLRAKQVVSFTLKWK